MHIFQPDRHLLAAFVEKHAKAFGGDILDVGGGTRRYTKLFNHCSSFKILDPDPASMPDILAPAEAIPLPDASVDGVVCTQVLGDVWEPQKAVDEMARVLKPGGKLLITESLFNEEHDPPNDYWRFTHHTWHKLLNEHFRIRELEPRGGYWSQRAQQAIRYRIEKHHAYDRPFAGRLINIWATVIGKLAMAKDRKLTPLSQKFTIGYCILAERI